MAYLRPFPGECPEWQRELTVNQPPYGFVGSSPTSPTILKSLEEWTDQAMERTERETSKRVSRETFGLGRASSQGDPLEDA
jgi:hypothetical protein